MISLHQLTKINVPSVGGGPSVRATSPSAKRHAEAASFKPRKRFYWKIFGKHQVFFQGLFWGAFFCGSLLFVPFGCAISTPFFKNDNFPNFKQKKTFKKSTQTKKNKIKISCHHQLSPFGYLPTKKPSNRTRKLDPGRVPTASAGTWLYRNHQNYPRASEAKGSGWGRFFKGYYTLED